MTLALFANLRIRNKILRFVPPEEWVPCPLHHIGVGGRALHTHFTPCTFGQISFVSSVWALQIVHTFTNILQAILVLSRARDGGSQPAEQHEQHTNVYFK